MSLDEVHGQFACDPSRARRSDLMTFFPKLSRRIELQGSTIEACLREAQARRASCEWSLEELDCGGVGARAQADVVLHMQRSTPLAAEASEHAVPRARYSARLRGSTPASQWPMLTITAVCAATECASSGGSSLGSKLAKVEFQRGWNDS